MEPFDEIWNLLNSMEDTSLPPFELSLSDIPWLEQGGSDLVVENVTQSMRTSHYEDREVSESLEKAIDIDAAVQEAWQKVPAVQAALFENVNAPSSKFPKSHSSHDFALMDSWLFQDDHYSRIIHLENDKHQLQLLIRQLCEIIANYESRLGVNSEHSALAHLTKI